MRVRTLIIVLASGATDRLTGKKPPVAGSSV